MDDRLASAIGNAPDKPGVYVWKDPLGRMLYVGKAGSLRDRLRSYLRAEDPKTLKLVGAASKIETVVTGSEEEALILEDALVKQNQPRYNVRLRDDKRYPYIRVTASEKHPRIDVVRRVVLDGSKYYGPYTDAQAVRRVISLVGGLFGLRRCRHDLRGIKRPCIQYRMGRCAAPCGPISEDEYRGRVERACRFLGGDNKSLRRELAGRIRAHSGKLEYEEAAELRDTLRALDSLDKRQGLSSAGLPDMDVLGYAYMDGRANVTQLKVREHKVAAVLHHPLKGEYADSPSESMKAFIKQHYAAADITPKLIVASAEPADRRILEAALAALGHKVRVEAAFRGAKRKLAEIAVENSLHQLEQDRLLEEAPKPLDALVRLLRLPRPPRRIEGYDVSNLGGKGIVAGMVVYADGAPDKREYRTFRIRRPGQDDARSLAEAVERRFGHDEWPTPDIVLLDGGRMQLSACAPHIPPGVTVLALAKENEELYMPSRREPVRLPKDHPGLLLLRGVRDEAHRFSGRYQRIRRKRSFLRQPGA